MATLPGVPLHAASGFTGTEREPVVTPDGSSIAGVVVSRPIGAHPQHPRGRRSDDRAAGILGR